MSGSVLHVRCRRDAGCWASAADTLVGKRFFFQLEYRVVICLQVTSFIREESRENMQIIVISLKEEFFSKADALLGVYSDVGHIFHVVYSVEIPPHWWVFPPLFSSWMVSCSAAFWPWTCVLTLWLKRRATTKRTRSPKQTEDRSPVARTFLHEWNH